MISIINGTQVNNAGNNLKSYASQINTKIKAIEDILTKIDSSWEGEDKEKFVSNMRENYIKSLTSLKEIIEKSGDFLCKTNTAYAELDKVFSGKGVSV